MNGRGFSLLRACAAKAHSCNGETQSDTRSVLGQRRFALRARSRMCCGPLFRRDQTSKDQRMLNARSPRSAALRFGAPVALATVFALAAPQEAQAAPSPSQQVKSSGGNTGVGVTLGSPMGFSLKHFMSAPHALQWNLGYGIMHHGGFRTDLSYLWHPATIAQGSVVDLVPYVGAGLGFGLWGHGHWHGHNRGHGHSGNTTFGLMFRLPAMGLALHWQKVPIDTVLEGAWSPMIEMHSGHGHFSANHGDIFLGARYYF